MTILQYIFGITVFGIVAWMVGQVLWQMFDSLYWYLKSKFNK